MYTDRERLKADINLISFAFDYADDDEALLKAICKHDHLNYEEKLAEFRKNKQKTVD